MSNISVNSVSVEYVEPNKNDNPEQEIDNQNIINKYLYTFLLSLLVVVTVGTLRLLFVADFLVHLICCYAFRCKTVNLTLLDYDRLVDKKIERPFKFDLTGIFVWSNSIVCFVALIVYFVER